MPRRALILVCLLAAAAAAPGCQTRPTSPAPRVTTFSVESDYDAVTASALVFDPPVVQGEPRLELSRAEREPRVAVGFEGETVERFYIRMDDRQVNDGFGGIGSRGGGGIYDRYERRAVTERIGVRYR
jgi:hypothetical protein